MRLVLNIYKDDCLTEVKRVAEADKLRIPYRVAMYVIQSLENADINSDNDLIKFITSNTDKLDKVIKATFNVSDTELECVDITELGAVGVEIYKWALAKFAELKGNNSKN